MKGFPRDVVRKNIVCFASNMGAHTWPTTLQTAVSTNPTAPQRRTSMGRMPMENLMDLRNLIKEEVAMHNYLLKSRNQKSPMRKWNSPKRRIISAIAAVAIATTPAHPEVLIH